MESWGLHEWLEYQETLNPNDIDLDLSRIEKVYKKLDILPPKDKKFLIKVKNSKSFYGKGDSAKKIVHVLEQINLNKIPIQKTMMY